MSKPLPDPADSFQRIEVITGTGRRRQWPDDVKTAIVAETLQEGAVITEIAGGIGFQRARSLPGGRKRVNAWPH
jgi:hypothetical protein